jgi:hypothetical protein
MSQVRITLLEKYRKPEELNEPIRLVYGTDVAVPMSFGGMTSEAINDFRGPRQEIVAEPRVWLLHWDDEAMRSTLVPQEVAAHYFGDQRCKDPAAVKALVCNPLNVERDRVAKIWGDYDFASEFGPYSSIKIDVPRMPKVKIQNVNGNGVTVGESFYDPWAFFEFEKHLDPRSAQLRLKKAQANRAVVSVKEMIEQLDENTLRQLAQGLAPLLKGNNGNQKV